MNLGTECCSAKSFLSHLLRRHSKFASVPSLLRGKPWKKGPKKHISCAKPTCLDAVIGGHSKFLLVTGECCKNRCPALQSFEKRACSARFWFRFFCDWLCGSWQFFFQNLRTSSNNVFLPGSPASGFKTTTTDTSLLTWV